jgi:hypothetical protein
MQPIASQAIDTQQIYYSNLPKTEADKPMQNGAAILTSRERKLKEIAVLTQYMEDLKAGRPVENISPSNDPYFLDSRVIADMIQGLRDMLAGKGRIVNSIEDIIGEWDI